MRKYRDYAKEWEISPLMVPDVEVFFRRHGIDPDSEQDDKFWHDMTQKYCQHVLSNCMFVTVEKVVEGYVQ